MGKNIYFFLYKDPEFKDHFYEINRHIDNDYYEYKKSLPRRYFKNGYFDAEDFNLRFSERDGIGKIYSIPKTSQQEIVDIIIAFWEKICKMTCY